MVNPFEKRISERNSPFYKRAKQRSSNEEMSDIQSISSAALEGVLHGGANIGSLSVSTPGMPISLKQGLQATRQLFPSKEGEVEDYARRAAKVGTELAIGPGGWLQKTLGTIGGTLAGQIAKNAGLSETGQEFAEMGGAGLTALAEMGVRKAAAALKMLSEKAPKLGKNLTNAFEKFQSGGGEPPGGLPGEFPFKDLETMAGNESYEIAEDILKKLQQPEEIFPKGLGIEVPVESKEVRPLTGRAKILENKASSQISPEKFYNEKHGGIDLSGRVKTQAKQQKIPVTKKYKIAEKVYQGESDTFPVLSEEVDSLISRINESGKLNTGEKAVLDQLEAIKKIVGDNRTGLIETSLKKLIKTADSISGLANYEMPFTGPKDLLKKLVKSINENVIQSLEKKGLNANAMREADKAYSEWAGKFLNDEISRFLERKILNPESNFRKAVSDEGTYRSLKNALGKKGEKSINKLERAIAENRLNKFFNNLEKIGSEEFNNEIRNLEGLIGKEKSSKLKSSMLKQKKLTPSVSKSSLERKLPKERITSASQIKASEYLGKTRKQILSMMDDPDGIRKLKADLKKSGHPELFDKLSQEKTIEILRGGVVSAEKITGRLIWENMRKPHNYEILKELYGKSSVDAALVDASLANKSPLSKEKLVRLGKLAGTAVGAGKLIKIISIML